MNGQSPALRSRFAVLAILSGIALLSACTPDGKRGDPALPSGFESTGVPQMNIQGFLYLNTGGPATISAAALSEQAASLGPLEVVNLEGVLNRPSSEYAVRVQLADAENAGRVASAIQSSPSNNRWSEHSGPHLMAGKPISGAWTEGLQEAWANGERRTLEEAYPDVWATMRLLPEDPPATPIAVGFVRNMGDIVEDVLSTGGISAPGLSSGLSLMRMEAIAGVVYADGLQRLPQAPTREALSDSRAGVLAVATSGYPGFIVDFLFPRFIERAGLEQTNLDGTVVFYRALDDDLHLMIKNYGPAFFFALSADRDGTEALMRSVITSQQSR